MKKKSKKPKPYFDSLKLIKKRCGPYVIKIEINDILGPIVAKEMGEWLINASEYLKENK